MQRFLEHQGVTHVLDFTPGSGGMAVAASGAIKYEGLSANDEHNQWLDNNLDRITEYLCAKDKEVTKFFDGEDDFASKVSEYLAGTMLEAKAMIEPSHQDENADDLPDESDDEEASDTH